MPSVPCWKTATLRGAGNKWGIFPREERERSVSSVREIKSPGNIGSNKSAGQHEELGDFSTTLRVLPISALAMGIGALCAFVALALLRLIGLFTNLFYFGRWNTAMVSPAGNHLGVYSVLVPIAGALIIGVMARYGSERIRGHGIPEAIEAILINGSRVEPKVALLKPISSAISIGSGGPFGAEGPIIMTGGALGSMIAQLFHLTSGSARHCWLPAPPQGCPQRSLHRLPRSYWPWNCCFL